MTLWAVPAMMAVLFLLNPADIFRIAMLVLSVILVAATSAFAQVRFEKLHLYINFGLYGRRIKYGNLEKIEDGKRLLLWQTGAKRPWDLKMKDDDRIAFIAELRRHNPRLVVVSK